MSKTIKQLKALQASSLVMFTKVHNYHWNVKGIQFYQIHNATEEVYDKFSEIFDSLAERIIQLGKKPLVSLKEYAQTSFIKEDEKTEFEAKYVLENILADFKLFLDEFKKLSDLAEEEGDKTTAALADEIVADMEKQIWMLSSTLA